MGFHICEYCEQRGKRSPATSSGDVTLTFRNGHSYEMPDMIVHYVQEHDYQPPVDFIGDVMSGDLVDSERWQTKSIPMPVGYLKGEYPIGVNPPLFVYVLAGMMAIAEKAGNRLQTRGM